MDMQIGKALAWLVSTFPSGLLNMGLDVRKPVFRICGQQRRIPAYWKVSQNLQQVKFQFSS